ncbi:MAG: twin arginine targeting protein translocase subunit TatC [Phycisphaerales bacterium]|jgi:sec-independent protein translocase protein TatC|nr:twin arginine targeting protein translocase subunit TatC [Phycisphaerales bacterium]MDB5303579.1 twin arginine targeting protein translocase subunit TatC [Phycisphaerales bacterium]
MSTATETDRTTKDSGPGKGLENGERKKGHDYDPDSFRMTVGEHLEDLRGRLSKALIGLFVAVVGSLPFSDKIMTFLIAPLTSQLSKHNMNPQLSMIELTESFMTYLKISLITAIAIAGPWIIYQLWQFVAAGLYPNERKTVTRYIPMSITLFMAGLVFVYVLVLPLSIKFFLDFSSAFHVPFGPHPAKVQNAPVWNIPVLTGDPAAPRDGDMWISQPERRMKIWFEGMSHAIPFGPDSLIAPSIRVSEYIDLVLTFMLTFGIAFQLPLVVLALVSLGIVEVSFLKKQRKMVYFVMTIAAAFLAPGDIVTSMLALLIPLVILYEFGIWLAVVTAKRKAQREALEEQR